MPPKRSAVPGSDRFSIVYAEAALDDLDRIFEFLATAGSIVSGVAMLAEHPLIGRPVSDGLRVLVVSFGNGGYVVLYRVRPRLTRVEVLSVRHQREAGFG